MRAVGLGLLLLVLVPGAAEAREIITAAGDVAVTDKVTDPTIHLIVLDLAFGAWGGERVGYVVPSAGIAWEARNRTGWFVRAGLDGGVVVPGARSASVRYRAEVGIPLSVREDRVGRRVPHKAQFGGGYRALTVKMPRRKVVALLVQHAGRVASIQDSLPVEFHPEFGVGIQLRREAWTRVRYVYEGGSGYGDAGLYSRRVMYSGRFGAAVRGGLNHPWMGLGFGYDAQWAGAGGGAHYGVWFDLGGYLPVGGNLVMVRDPEQTNPLKPTEGLGAPVRVGIEVTLGFQPAAWPAKARWE